MQEIKDLGKRFEAIKHEFGYSNQELGEICEVSYTAIGNIINGITKNPSISLFINISRKLDVNMEWLIFGSGEMLKSKSIRKEQPDQLKYIKLQNIHLKAIIEAREDENATLKKVISLLEREPKTKSVKK